MASKEKVDIKRSDQFQEMEDALTQAMADLDSTLDRVSAVFRQEEDGPEGADADPPRDARDAADTKESAARQSAPAPNEKATDEPTASE